MPSNAPGVQPPCEDAGVGVAARTRDPGGHIGQRSITTGESVLQSWCFYRPIASELQSLPTPSRRLQLLGIVAFFSRPSVTDDNAHGEPRFRNAEHRHTVRASASVHDADIRTDGQAAPGTGPPHPRSTSTRSEIRKPSRASSREGSTRTPTTQIDNCFDTHRDRSRAEHDRDHRGNGDGKPKQKGLARYD